MPEDTVARGITSARSTSETTPLSRSRDRRTSPHAQQGVAKPKQRTTGWRSLELSSSDSNAATPAPRECPRRLQLGEQPEGRGEHTGVRPTAAEALAHHAPSRAAGIDAKRRLVAARFQAREDELVTVEPRLPLRPRQAALVRHVKSEGCRLEEFVNLSRAR
eukprot:scaffold101434_cov57-Phaeocystis_antarctica.AAC.4